MLCSRAITREEAAMSGSIAAFVLLGLLYFVLPGRFTLGFPKKRVSKQLVSFR